MATGQENTAPFTQGLELSKHFYWEAVRPILDAKFHGLVHAAALLGSGSEVLGFDDPMSSDHHWGPRVMIFLTEADHSSYASAMVELLRHKLPYEFYGYPTSFSEPDPNDNGVQHLQRVKSGPINHRVEVLTIRGFIHNYLNFDIDQPIEAADWLTFPQQKLRTITAGMVYHDAIGLEEARARFAWYPHDLWLYLLAAGWARIGQEEHLMGRAGLVGDELGSALIGSRLVRDIMRLAFLMERQYAPYPKWFGTAFKQLACAETLADPLFKAQTALTWRQREAHLVDAYEILARMHNRLGITDPLPGKARPFFGRPFRVMALHGFTDALIAQIEDPSVQQIAQRRPIGSVDLFSDSTDLLEAQHLRPRLRDLYT
ncbi:MAG: DUF4037 domain-containing protein [Caldilineaceae bacterium]|nr:DUF4037 domain-containing protein [Caldilineaceae bacterium]